MKKLVVLSMLLVCGNVVKAANPNVLPVNRFMEINRLFLNLESPLDDLNHYIQGNQGDRLVLEEVLAQLDLFIGQSQVVRNACIGYIENIDNMDIDWYIFIVFIKLLKYYNKGLNGPYFVLLIR